MRRMWSIVGLTLIVAFGNAALAQMPRSDMDYYCSQASNIDSPRCVKWVQDYRKRMEELARQQAGETAPAQTAPAAPSQTPPAPLAPLVTDVPATPPADTRKPVLQVVAPSQVDLAAGAYRIEGLVGDDGSLPSVSVNGAAQSLTEAPAGSRSLGRYTKSFAVTLPARAAGTDRVAIEACDAARNCVRHTVAVSVVAPPPPAPAPAPAPSTAPAAPPQTAQARASAPPAQAPAPAAPAASDETEKMLQALLQRLEKEGAPVSSDRELPIIKVQAPETAEVGKPATVSGLVGDNGSPPRLTVNGQQVPLFRPAAGSAGVAAHTLSFEFLIDTEKAGPRSYVLEACDADRNCIAEKVALNVTLPNRPNAEGRNFALIIGNNDYRNMPGLKTAVYDASSVADVLQSRYAFRSEDVQLLLNADRVTILGALSDLRDKLSPDDRLLIYYAGHGQIDPGTSEGFWLPVDARPDKDFSWIANGDIRRYLRGMPARHVLVVADSCFSGSLTRSVNPQASTKSERFFAEIDASVSRHVIASGGTEPVADSGTGGHSVFAYYFLKALRDNQEAYLTSFEVYGRLARAVTNNSSQKPEFGTISEAGDEGAGDFTFIRRKAAPG